MSELVLVMILMATTAYVAKPYWQRQKVTKLDSHNGQLTDLLERRDNLLAAIKEIEFDCQTGKISAEDFTEMNAKYRFEAITVMKRIDNIRGNNRASQRLEEELRSMRLQRKTKGRKHCTQCGKTVSTQDRYCFACGHLLKHR